MDKIEFLKGFNLLRSILLLLSADVGLGIFSAIFVSYVFHSDVNFLLIFVGIIFALLPDFDFLFHYLSGKGKGKDHEHRNIIHYPIIYLGLGSLIVLALFGNYFALLFLIASLLHFIHDSIGIGWGVKWLFPFSKRNFAFLYLYSRKEKKGLRKLIFSFSENNLSYYVKEHGDPDWLKNIYYQWH